MCVSLEVPWGHKEVGAACSFGGRCLLAFQKADPPKSDYLKLCRKRCHRFSRRLSRCIHTKGQVGEPKCVKVDGVLNGYLFLSFFCLPTFRRNRITDIGQSDVNLSLLVPTLLEHLVVVGWGILPTLRWVESWLPTNLASFFPPPPQVKRRFHIGNRTAKHFVRTWVPFHYHPIVWGRLGTLLVGYEMHNQCKTVSNFKSRQWPRSSSLLELE